MEPGIAFSNMSLLEGKLTGISCVALVSVGSGDTGLWWVERFELGGLMGLGGVLMGLELFSEVFELGGLVSWEVWVLKGVAVFSWLSERVGGVGGVGEVGIWGWAVCGLLLFAWHNKNPVDHVDVSAMMWNGRL